VFDQRLIGAFNMLGFDKDDRGLEMRWNSLSLLNQEDREKMMLLLLFELVRKG
jgi:hypothetical protein